MKILSTRQPGRAPGIALLSLILCLGTGTLIAAPAAEEAALPPPPDSELLTSSSSSKLPHSHKNHKLSLGTVAPKVYPSKPQEAITEIKSHEQRKTEIEMKRR